MEIRYYQCDREPYDGQLVLRRTLDATGLYDERWADGRWQPTTLVMRWMFGREDDVDPISEQQARELAPAAF